MFPSFFECRANSSEFIRVEREREREREKRKRWYCIDFTSMAMFNKDRIDFSRNQLHVFPMKLDRSFLPFSLSLSLSRARFVFPNMRHIFDTSNIRQKKRRKKIAHNVLIYMYEWVKFFESTCQLDNKLFYEFSADLARALHVHYTQCFNHVAKYKKVFSRRKIFVQFFHRNSSKWRDKQRDAREPK